MAATPVLGVWKTIRLVEGRLPLRDFDLVIVTAETFGRDGRHTNFKEIIDRALKVGLKHCPRYAGYQLRALYLDQPDGDRLHTIVTMGPADVDSVTVEILGHNNIYPQPVGSVERGMTCYTDQLSYLQTVLSEKLIFVKPRK